MKPKTKKAIIAVSVLSAVLMAISIAKIVDAKRQYELSEKEYEDLKGAVITTAPSSPDSEKQYDGYLTLDFGQLYEINSDFKFWIDIPNTDISYPVVQASDNDYYLRRSFEGNSNVGGVVFVDYRCAADLSGRNAVIYGHRMNDGSMFASLKSYMDKSFCEKHQEIHLYRPDGISVYKVFSVSKATTGCDCFTFAFNSDYDFSEWLSRQVYRSIFETGVVPDPTDSVITLVTCTGQEEWRYIVQAVLTEEIEYVN